jgi:hypothetical protein
VGICGRQGGVAAKRDRTSAGVPLDLQRCIEAAGFAGRVGVRGVERSVVACEHAVRYECVPRRAGVAVGWVGGVLTGAQRGERHGEAERRGAQEGSEVGSHLAC